MDINQIRLNYKYCMLNNENNELQPVLKFIMTELEKQHITNNLHKSFCFFSDDNVAFTNPTYNSLEQTSQCKFTDLEVEKAYFILFDHPPILKPTDPIPTQISSHSKYRDISLPFGIASKTEILAPIGSSHKITELDRKLMKLTIKTIQQLRLSTEEKQNLINKTKLLRTISKKKQSRCKDKKCD